MSLLSQRLKYTDEKLKELKSSQKAAQKEKRKSVKEQRDVLKRKQFLVGAIVLDRVQRGMLSFEEFSKMMDEELVRAEDRKLFGLD
ncbi:hypothetical protein G6K88_31455 [Agrobacterium rhizogenes]|uniref:hypothetical protein n=1 Tax=Rhizobium rhizogenes TaxID=359 RepID=UPI00115CA007|nr:hypothetical protein [Rhizobium rhizogenes]NTG38927.1 hypothetical protein [Rhizobium rhizogenes]NTG58051.1 hypothetical protein [Rhizobium rhizogenes]NTI06555.1 hypothetical protein [Rhizobium rhizogenes]NTI13360.1 hypothetical protein [Rhizobium rhizogenes]TRB15049.1 hypothetical protein EXN70_34115 [Rhizobium rhizogenes]